MPTSLVVDDQRAIRNMFKSILESGGYDVTLAEDGKDGWTKASIKDFDVIVTDLNMPNVDGIQLTKRLRASKRHKYTPILIISTVSNGAKKQLGRDAGASGWIVKPVNGDELLSALRKLCS